MTRLKLHDNGWLTLPATLRQALGLQTNAMLEVELVDGAIVLQPAGAGRVPAKPELQAAEPPVVTVSQPSAVAEAPARRKPGRPRKVQAAEPLAPAAPPRPRGRPRKVPPAVMADTAAPASVTPPSELRRKVAPVVAEADRCRPGSSS